MRSFFHAGDVGDVIYSLAAVEKLGGGEVLMAPRHNLGKTFQPRQGISRTVYAALYLLVGRQPYVQRTQWFYDAPFCEHDLNRFRLHWDGLYGDVYDRAGWRQGGWHNAVSLQKMHLAVFGIDEIDDTRPWLDAGMQRVAPVLFARTARYHNHKFPWRKVIDKYAGKATFVGLKKEYDAFCKDWNVTDEVGFHGTGNFWDLACAINACDLFVGNQSAPYAIAEGLKKQTIQETRIDVDDGPDCLFDRPNAQFVFDGNVELPDL